MDATSIIIGIHHIALTVFDAKAAALFYQKAANFQPAPRADATLQLPTGNAVRGVAGSTLLRGLNGYLRLLEPCHIHPTRADRRSVAEAGIVHVCMQSTSIHSLYDSFEAAGATFHAPPVDLGTGFLYSYARDVEANVIELEGVPPVWDDTAPWIAHVSFSSYDIDRLAGFYAAVLSQPVTKSPRLGPHARFDAVSGLQDTEFRGAWIAAGNLHVEVFQYFVPATTAHLWPRSLAELGYSYVCFEVHDVVAAAALFISQGAAQSSQLADLSDANHYFCTDPDGNILLLLKILPANQTHSITGLPDPQIGSRMALRRNEISQQKTAKAI